MANTGGEPIRLHYFKGRGRAETTRWMLAVNRIDFANVALASANELAALRATGKLPFDQLPLLEIDGLNLSQSTAMIRYLARRGDLYGDSDDDRLWCDMVAGASADFAETAMQAAFQPTAAVAEANLRKAFAKFGPRFEARLTANGGRHIAGSRLSFADVVLTEALTSYRELVPDILDPTPGLADLQRRITELPGIAAYLASPNRWPVPDDQYVIDVARVLRRALPPHMPDPDRFVVTA